MRPWPGAPTVQPLLDRLHSRALTVTYADLERYALAQGEVFVATAGSAINCTIASEPRLHAHQFSGGDGKT